MSVLLDAGLVRTIPTGRWYDFSGKTIRPFCTHEGSGLGNSVSDIRRICPGANIGKGLAVNGSSVKGARKDVERWAGEI